MKTLSTSLVYTYECYLWFQVGESKIFERDGVNVSSTVTISFTQVRYPTIKHCNGSILFYHFFFGQVPRAEYERNLVMCLSKTLKMQHHVIENRDTRIFIHKFYPSFAGI